MVGKSKPAAPKKMVGRVLTFNRQRVGGGDPIKLSFKISKRMLESGVGVAEPLDLERGGTRYIFKMKYDENIADYAVGKLSSSMRKTIDEMYERPGVAQTMIPLFINEAQYKEVRAIAAAGGSRSESAIARQEALSSSEEDSSSEENLSSESDDEW